MGTIEDIVKDEYVELADLQVFEVERLVSAMSPEGLKIRAARRTVRYKLYRCRTEALGKGASGCTNEFKQQFEKQTGFGGWRFFAVNWDVEILDPYKIIARDHSEEQVWDDIVRSTFPQVTASGGVVYPDIKVKKRVEAEAKKQSKKRKKASGG